MHLKSLILFVGLLGSVSSWATCNSGAPLGWPVDQAQIRDIHGCKTRSGVKNDPSRCHNGIALSSPVAITVRAVCDGALKIPDKPMCETNNIAKQKNKAAGKPSSCRIQLSCANGKNVTLSGLSFLQVDEGRVSRGQPIGQVGGTSNDILTMNVCRTPGVCGSVSTSSPEQIDPATQLDSCNATLRHQLVMIKDSIEQNNLCGSSQKCFAYNKTFQQTPPPKKSSAKCGNDDNLTCISKMIFGPDSKLPIHDQKEIVAMLPIEIGSDGMVDTTCGKEVYAKSALVDLNNDKKMEVVITEGNACAYGLAGGKNHFFAKLDNKWKNILDGTGDPFSKTPFVVTDTIIDGWNVVQPGNTGFCYAEYAWSAKKSQYEWKRGVPDPSSPGACIGVTK